MVAAATGPEWCGGARACSTLLAALIQCCYQWLTPCAGTWSASANWLKMIVIGGLLRAVCQCQVPLKLDDNMFVSFSCNMSNDSWFGSFSNAEQMLTWLLCTGTHAPYTGFSIYVCLQVELIHDLFKMNVLCANLTLLDCDTKKQTKEKWLKTTQKINAWHVSVILFKL